MAFNVIVFITFTIIASLSSSYSSMAASPVMRGAYYPSWAAQSFPPSAINTRLYTHVYYAFLSPDPSSFKFKVPDNQSPLLLNFTSTLHASRPPAKAIFSIGGASEGTALFSRMASNRSSRAAFISSSIRLARRFGFDGIDLDWEFPQDSNDMLNYGLLLDEWRAEVCRAQAPLLLTAAVYYSADTFLSGPPRAYPAASIRRNLDWINVMNYDYHGGWDKTATGAQAALFDPTGNLSTSFGLRSWIGAGVPRKKVIMGLPVYGRTWRLKDPLVHGVGAAAVDVGPGDEGVLTYAEIVKFNREMKAKVVYDAATVSAYSVAGTSWVGYDDATSVKVKIRYARRLGIGGYFFWALSYDYDSTISKTALHAWPGH